MRTLSVSIISMFIAVLLFSGCNLVEPVDLTDGSPLVGTWNMTRQIKYHANGTSDTTDASAFFSNKYTFSNDYSLSGTTVLIGISINFGGTWSATTDSVTINADVAGTTTTSTSHFSISGTTLYLTSEDVEGSGTVTIIEIYQKQ